ncbi:MAG: insulinase family protein [Clostridiales bacterium]|nr:insulinase family protein [Clostridiales bacterium]
MVKLITYPNNLRVVMDQNTSVRSVCVGIWVGVGSSSENAQSNGIAHFTEHMLFKGTSVLDAYQIADKFESVGAMVNAFTGKESTCYYFKCMDDYVSSCFQILSDIFFDSAFKADDLDKERKVIIEEINMTEDVPEDLAFDLISKVNFLDHPLGQTILGPIDNINKFDKKSVDSFMKQHYVASNVVLSFAGNITEEKVDEIVRTIFLDRVSLNVHKKVSMKKPKQDSNSGMLFKEFEQSNLIISFPSIKFNDSKTPILSLLSTILGGGMSSRLFQKVREQSGLAYSIFSTPTFYSNCGMFNVVCNITPLNTQKVLHMLKSELNEFVKNGVNDREFERAKAQLKSAFVFGQESVQACMIAAGKLMLSSGEIIDYNQRVEQINSVTKKQLTGLIGEIFNFDKVSCAYVGKDMGIDIMQFLK